MALCALGLAGCSPALSGLLSPRDLSTLSIPIQGGEQFQVEEYPLVEQSTDNPVHAGFEARVPAAVTARRAAWRVPSPETAIAGPNQALARFGYHLAINPTPPFTAYAIYFNQQLLQDDIMKLWPLTLNAKGDDFLLPIETLDGQRQVVSRAGLNDWPGEQASGKQAGASAPIFLGDQLAYAAVSDSGVSVLSGSNTLFKAEGSPNAAGSELQTFGDGHWALETDGKVFVDGRDLANEHHYDQVFDWQQIEGRPFYFYQRGGLIHMNYAGQNLPLNYDQVVHGDTGETAIFNPGGNEHMIWFYALRDGLWYYVEAGVFGAP